MITTFQADLDQADVAEKRYLQTGNCLRRIHCRVGTDSIAS
jgi:hypothetical protein